MPPSRRHVAFDPLLLNDSLFQLRSAARNYKPDAAITGIELNAMSSELARYPGPRSGPPSMISQDIPRRRTRKPLVEDENYIPLQPFPAPAPGPVLDEASRLISRRERREAREAVEMEAHRAAARRLNVPTVVINATGTIGTLP
ncbi:hypothetical protein DFH06DRAFT_1149737 [Mycena polygramma]|nr:hypothetical protein DFH06DRAFT_1149737 [Mycena polygramma]